MDKTQILWADDEIDLLKPHIIFLENKGYEVITTNNGHDAIALAKEHNPDLVLLDENMPGLSGLETLLILKENKPDLHVVMITKNEEEHIMEEAIGSKISDYLIKPVNPNQILLSIKKLVDKNRIVTEKATSRYMQEFRNISMSLMDNLSYEEWVAIYKKLVYWALELEVADEEGLKSVWETQMTEANNNFGKFISKNYVGMLDTTGDDNPVMSHNLMRRNVVPLCKDVPVFFILIDNLRYDQWKTLAPLIGEKFNVVSDDIYLSTLPTTTQYCRNSIFSGLLPSEIYKRFPDKWSFDEDEGGKNNFEDFFLEDLMKRLRFDKKTSYHKIVKLHQAKELNDSINNLFTNELNVIVYNFVDALSHARTDSHVIRELAEDEAAYRSLTLSWFRHSPLWDTLQQLSEKPCKVIITTDHGSVKVGNPVKIVGDKNTTTNLRYKQGKNLGYNAKEVFEITKPESAYLPKSNMSTSYVFTRNNDFFAYPNNYNHYVNYYKNTLQHGGISLEEMLIPFIVLEPNK